MDSRHLERVRRVEPGPSSSGPIVARDWVFTTQANDKKSEVGTAHDRKTGKELWRFGEKGIRSRIRSRFQQY